MPKWQAMDATEGVAMIEDMVMENGWKPTLGDFITVEGKGMSIDGEIVGVDEKRLLIWLWPRSRNSRPL